MRKIIVHEFITLDAVMQAPGGEDEDREGGFSQGGWTRPFWHDDIGKHFGEVMQESDAFLLGRKTWQIHGAAFDPMPEGDPFGDIMKKVQKYVVSNTLKSVGLWRNSTLIKGNAVEEVRKLKRLPGKNILVDGSSVLVHSLVENSLIDEFRLHIYPVILGSGKRLFPDGRRVNLKLVESKHIPTGVIYAKYLVEDEIRGH